MENEKSITQIFASNIRKLRSRNGVTGEELASALRVSQSTVSDWENAKKMPREGSLEKIAAYFGVSKTELLADYSGILPNTSDRYYGHSTNRYPLTLDSAFDGRVDIEKLRLLIDMGERDDVDFKSAIDLDTPKGKLELVKDIAAMSNSPDGGYLIVGVSDDGVPVTSLFETSKCDKVDAAKINDLLNKYLEKIPKIIVQAHEMDSFLVVVICVFPHEDNLPVPFKRSGQFEVNKRAKHVFREGEIYLRESAQNVHIKWSHWPRLLAKRDQMIRDESRKDIDSIVRQLSDGGILNPSIALDVDADNLVFSNELKSAYDTSRIAPIERVLSRLRLSFSSESYMKYLDKLTIIACESLIAGHIEHSNQVIDIMHTCFSGHNRYSDAVVSAKLMNLVAAVYIIGSMAVRERQWIIVKELSLREGTPRVGDYYTTSWIREMQVAASQGNLFPKTGLMISIARRAMHVHDYLRPDLVDIDVPEVVGANDYALDSLCQFDFLYCIWVNAHESGRGGGSYPASVYYNSSRVDSVADLVVGDKSKGTVLAGLSDVDIAGALEKLYKTAGAESLRLRTNWFPSGRTADFINEHKP
ncbi:MAG: helix-turn-helix domain-containing protein [Coriobacteriia bacterium]|nr:helix-turn-helix domain-containing protein [Coriobacteriia bacterium]